MQSLMVRRFGTLILNSLSHSHTRSFSSVSATVAVPAPTTFPPPITESTTLHSIESSQRHFIEHLAPHLTPSILPSVQASFNLTTRCLAFCTLYRLSYPEPSVHHLLHPLILAGNANPESILDELARARERLNVDTTSVFDALILADGEMKEARQLLDDLKTRGFKPDYISYNLLIGGYSYSTRSLNMKEAFRVRDEMLKNGLDPTFTTYHALILGLCDNNEFEHAEELLKEMVNKGICTSDDSSYLTLTEILHEK